MSAQAKRSRNLIQGLEVQGPFWDIATSVLLPWLNYWQKGHLIIPPTHQ